MRHGCHRVEKNAGRGVQREFAGFPGMNPSIFLRFLIQLHPDGGSSLTRVVEQQKMGFPIKFRRIDGVLYEDKTACLSEERGFFDRKNLTQGEDGIIG